MGSQTEPFRAYAATSQLGGPTRRKAGGEKAKGKLCCEKGEQKKRQRQRQGQRLVPGWGIEDGVVMRRGACGDAWWCCVVLHGMQGWL